MDVVTNGESLKESDDFISESISAIKKVKLRGSLKERLTLSFIIKSTNLKILDPIGQGSVITPLNVMNSCSNQMK